MDGQIVGQAQKGKKMTVIRIGRRDSSEYMEFAFDDAMDAFNFYSEVKDHYREDDLVISMVEEKHDEETFGRFLKIFADCLERNER